MAGKKGSSSGKKSSGGKTVRFRSAVTGHYVSEKYAKSHPKSTVKETDK